MLPTNLHQRFCRRLAPASAILAFAFLVLASATATCAQNASPFPQPDTLVGVGPAFPSLGRPLAFYEVLSGPELDDVRGCQALDRVVGFDLGRRRLTGGAAPERLFTAFWWGEPLATLGVAPLLGRTFTADELARGAKVAVLSERAWQRIFGGDPGAIGKTVEIEVPQVEGAARKEEHLVIGVLPPGVTVYETDLWLPMWAPETALPRARRQFQILARIRPGQTVAGVNAELSEIARRVETEHVAQHAEYAGWKLEAATWDDILRDSRFGR